MNVTRHWLIDSGYPDERTSIEHDEATARHAGDRGYRVRGPYVLEAEQLRGAVVIDDAAITRAADAIGALGTDRIGAEPYAAARAILDAARGQ